MGCGREWGLCGSPSPYIFLSQPPPPAQIIHLHEVGVVPQHRAGDVLVILEEIITEC